MFARCAPFIALTATLLASGCKGDAPDTGDTADTGDEPECLEDATCGDNQICEQQECILGDRDDTFDGARPIYQVGALTDPGVLSGLIHEPGDIDHFVYQAAGPGWIRVTTLTDGIDGGLDTVVSVFRSDGSLHHYMDEYATGSLRDYDSRMQVWLPTAGDWFIRVEDRSTFYGDSVLRGNAGYSYQLGVEAWSSVSEEPDSLEDPSVNFQMQSGSTVYAWGVVLEEPGDVDWTTAEMPWGDAPFEVWAPESIPGSDLTAVVDVTDGDGITHMQKVDVGPAGYGSTFWSDQLVFNLGVSDEAGGGSLNHWTVIYLRTREEGYGNPREIEPNDELGDATPLDPETISDGGVTTDRSFLQGRIGELDDVDTYRFGAVEGGKLRLACSSDSYGALGDVDVTVVNPAGETVVVLEDGDDLAPDGEVDGLTAGAYSLQFRAKDGAFGPAVYYRCGVYSDRP